jgi:hypothetical protein
MFWPSTVDKQRLVCVLVRLSVEGETAVVISVEDGGEISRRARLLVERTMEEGFVEIVANVQGVPAHVLVKGAYRSHVGFLIPEVKRL